MKSRLLGHAPLLGVLLTLALASSAQAGTLSKPMTTLIFSESDAVGTGNVVRVATSSGNLTYTDTASPTTVSTANCSNNGTTVGPNTPITCSTSGVSSLSFSMGGGNDVLTFPVPATSLPITAVGGPGNDDLDTANGADTLRGGADDDTLAAGGGSDVVDGDAGNDTVAGASGDDTVAGGAGNDTLNPGTGSDLVDGGPGTDLISFLFNRTTGVSVTLDNQRNDGGPDDGGALDDLRNIENVTGSPFDDTLSAAGQATGVALNGADGNDRLTGGNAADTLDGGSGNDALDGAGGTDTVRGGTGADAISARDGISDNVDCGADPDSVVADAVDLLSGCESVSLPPVVTPVPVPTPTPTPTPRLRQMAVKMTYVFFPSDPKATTRFKPFKLRSIPKGAKLDARCVTAKRKKCKGRAGKVFKKSFGGKAPKRGRFRLKAFERTFRAGSTLEITISKPGYVTQIKIVKVRRNKDPLPGNDRCIRPPSTKRRAC